jgi:TIR domain
MDIVVLPLHRWRVITCTAQLGRTMAPTAARPKKKPVAGKTPTIVGDAKPHPAKVKVFISYAAADNSIATALREEITEINRDRVECFLDTETIESGEGWEKKLEEALEAADWLVCLYTGDQSEFCGYEIGVFTRGKALQRNARNSRLVCLHDVPNYPAMFRAHQNRYIELPPERVAPDETFDETGFLSTFRLGQVLRGFL